MSEEKKQEILGEIKKSLEEIPEKYQHKIGSDLTHDIGVIKRTINMIENEVSK